MKNLFSNILILLSPLLLFMNTCLSRAEENSVGTITEVQGEATITRSDGREVNAEKDLFLFPGDAIATGRDGVVGFVLNDGDLFRINEDAHVTLDELISSEEDTPPVLRLSLGFLWSKLKYHLNHPDRQVIHTPTAVIGVRGTEFDTVVTEDSSSKIVVDEGLVEVEVKDATLVVEQGQSTEVDSEEKILPLVTAIPKERRDWKKFRRERAEIFLTTLLRNSLRVRKRFERDMNRYRRVTRRVKGHADQIDSSIKKYYDARKRRDRRAAQEQLKKIRLQEKNFRPMVLRFRKATNRVRVIGRNAAHIKIFFQKHRDRFGPADLAAIDSNLFAVSQKLVELKNASGRAVADIKQTYRNLRKLGQSINRNRPKKTK